MTQEIRHRPTRIHRGEFLGKAPRLVLDAGASLSYVIAEHFPGNNRASGLVRGAALETGMRFHHALNGKDGYIAES